MVAENRSDYFLANRRPPSVIRPLSHLFAGLSWRRMRQQRRQSIGFKVKGNSRMTSDVS